jgi:hypothetical protein
MLLTMRITRLLVRLALLTGGRTIVAHRGIAVRLVRVLVSLHPILLSALLVPGGVVVAADHNLRHRRGRRKKCSQTDG